MIGYPFACPKFYGESAWPSCPGTVIEQGWR